MKKAYTYLLDQGFYTVLTFTVITRFLVFQFYDGITYFKDSGDYIELADLILNNELIGYHGARTPGYSIFLALFGNNHLLVIIIQNLLGVFSLYMIYSLCKQWVTKKLAVIVGLIIGCYLPFVFYDFAILTESLSTFTFILLIWYLNKTNFFKQENNFSVYLKIGLLCAILFLVRPFFIYVPFLIIGFFTISQFSLLRTQFFHLVLCALVPVMTLIGWNSFNKYNTGIFMTSSYEGINLAQVGTSFYEKLPEVYSAEREILLKHRSNIVATKPNNSYPMTIWYAREELKEVKGMTDLELSLHLKKMSKDLILENPTDYIRQIGISFCKFFGSENTLLWNVEHFNHFLIRKGLVGIWIYLQQYVLILLNIVFLISSFFFLFKNGKINRWGMIQFVVLSVILGAVFQAMITYGTNSRFCYPFTFLILVCVVKFAQNSFEKRLLSPAKKP